MATKIDIPGVSGRLENLINDIKEAWDKHSKWIIPTSFFLIAIVVFWEVVKKRWRR